MPKHDKRVQTSTVTVAVLPEPTEVQLYLDPDDLEVTTTRGSGAGGQKRNKVETCVVVRHLPSGTTVRCETERSQFQNKASAMALLRARLLESRRTAAEATRASARKAQVGVGARGDKRRTIRMQDGSVHDHVSGRRWTFRDYERGDW